MVVLVLVAVWIDYRCMTEDECREIEREGDERRRRAHARDIRRWFKWNKDEATERSREMIDG
jgi:hypothetical protein